jgi:glutathione S-transferase
MALALYHNPISTCSQKVRLALAEKRLSFESHVIHFERQEHLSDWYLRLNPNGVVPTLVHDERPIIDSSVICEYLDEVFPDPALAPGGAFERAQMRAWMRYFEEVPTVALRIPSFNRVFARFLTAMKDDDFQAMTDKMPLRKHFYRQMGPKGFSDQAYDESIEKLRKCLERVAVALADGRAYVLGPSYSIADIVLAPSIVRMDDLGLHHLWDDLPSIAAWYERVQARPTFDVAYFPGSRIKLAALETTAPSPEEKD